MRHFGRLMILLLTQQQLIASTVALASSIQPRVASASILKTGHVRGSRCRNQNRSLLSHGGTNESPKKKGPPPKNKPPKESQSESLDNSGEDDSQQSSIAPSMLEDTNSDLDINPGEDADTTNDAPGSSPETPPLNSSGVQSPSTSSLSGSTTIGFSIGGVFFVGVLIFLLKQKQSKRKVKTQQRNVENVDSAKDTKIISESEDSDNLDGPFAGVYKLCEHLHFDEFLKAMDMSWSVRSVTLRAKPIQFVTHRGDKVTLKMKGAPRITLIMGGPVATNILFSRPFACTAHYTKNIDGFEVHHEALDGGTNLRMQWTLCGDTETVRLTMAAIFTQDNREPVQCVHTFRRIGEF